LEDFEDGFELFEEGLVERELRALFSFDLSLGILFKNIFLFLEN